MKKCSNCGFSNDDDARFCAGCGSSLADAPVVNEQAANVQADDPFAEPAATPADNATAYDQTQGEQPQEAKSKKGFKGTVASVKDKTVGFEKKHSIILNAIVILCSLVVIFVALFAPIKVVNYQLVVPSMLSRNPDSFVITDDYSVSDDNEEYTVHYVEISQSIWQIIGATSYFGADEKAYEELADQLDKIEEKAEKEYMEWTLKNIDLDDVMNMDEDDMIAYQMKAQNKYVEIYASYLSDINVLGYVFAKSFLLLDELTGNNYDGDYDSLRPTVDEEDRITMNLVKAFESIGLASVVVILAIVMAIVSLVYLIKAIIGMVKKKPQNKLYKYFGTMLGISGAGLILSMCAPVLAPGGGMLAIAVFISIMYFLCGAVGSIFFGQDGLLISIKNTAIALVSMLAFFLLCTNIFSITSGSEYEVTTITAPMGYGFGYFFDGFMLSMMQGRPTYALALQLTGAAANSIGAFVAFIWMIFAVSFFFSAYKRTLKRLAFGSVAPKSSCTALAITGAVFAIISIVVSMMLPGMFAEALGEGIGYNFDLDLSEIAYGVAIRAQVWVSMIFFLICAIFNMVFNPKSKNPAANEGQQM